MEESAEKRYRQEYIKTGELRLFNVDLFEMSNVSNRSGTSAESRLYTRKITGGEYNSKSHHNHSTLAHMCDLKAVFSAAFILYLFANVYIEIHDCGG